MKARPLYRRIPALIAVAAVGLAGCVGVDADVQRSAGEDDVAESQAALQQDGPFASVSALKAYWAAQSTSGAATQIYVNGHNVYQRSGVGPAFVKQYFDCRDHSGIKAKCDGPYDGFVTIRDAEAAFPFQGQAVYLDGVLYASGSASALYLKTCGSETSFAGPLRYFVATEDNNGFITFFGPGCYP